MPTLLPQQAPLPQEAPDFDSILAEYGIGPTIQPQRGLLSGLVEDELRDAYRQATKPRFSGFLSDLASTFVGTAPDLLHTMINPARAAHQYGVEATGEAMNLFAQDMANVEQEAQQRIENETNPSLVDLTVASFSKGFVTGADFGLRNLPVIGDYAHATLGPVNEAMERLAVREVQLGLNAMQSRFGQGTLVELPAIVSGLGGTLAGGYITMKPWFALGNALLTGSTRLRGAASFAEGLKDIQAGMLNLQGSFLGDITGSMLFGAVTGERGFLSATSEGPIEAGVYGRRLFEMQVKPTDPWWKQNLAHAVNRAEAAVAMGVDDFVLSALIATGFGALGRMGWYATAKMKQMRAQLLGGEPIDAAKIMAMRQSMILTDPGQRRFAVMRTPKEAEAYVDLLSQEELITASPAAQRLLVEQQAVEGIVSYHSQLAALTRAVNDVHVSGEATHGVLRGVDDPYRMLREVRNVDSPPLDAAQVFRRADDILEPLVHSVDDIPEAAIFGYTEGWTSDALSGTVRSVDSRIPIFLKNRPKAPAVERGNVEEIIVVPGKPWEFDSWNHVMERYGSVDDMIRAAQRNNVDLVNVYNTGAHGGVQHIVLDPSSIKSAQPVTPAVVGRLMNEQVDADRILAELGEEPLEVALKRRLPDMRFETPVRRDDGTYDIIFAPEGSPGLSSQQLRQFKETGFFSGQRVMYGGKTWEVVRRRGAEGRGSTIQLRSATTGDLKNVSVSKVFELPSAMVSVDVDDALYRDWLQYFDEKLRLVGERQIDEPTLRNIAMASDDPARMNRDFVDQGLNAIIHPHEMVAQIDVAEALSTRVREIDQELAQLGMDPRAAPQIQALVRERNALQQQVQEAAVRAQAEGALSSDIDLEKAFVDFPDEMDYGTVVFQDWARNRGIELQPGESQALKYSFYRRMNEEVFSNLPDDLQAQYRSIQDDLVEALEELPDNLDTTAALAGFEVLRLKNNTLVLRRPGSLHYEGMFSSEEAAQAALHRSLRYGSVPNMTPQYNYLDAALPTGHGLSSLGQTSFSDMHYLLSDDARDYLTRQETWSSGKYLTGKPAWLAPFEDTTGIPLWTDYVEPLFTAQVRAANEEIPFISNWIDSFVGLDLDERLGLRDFIRTIESHTSFLDIDNVVSRARGAGLNAKQIRALRGMRSTMDEMFQIGTNLYGWTPQDYIYNYLTKMWPQNQAYIRGDIGPSRRMYTGLVPDELDVFMSKYSRNGMLPVEEEDPLVIGMKYIRTFFHEAHVRQPYERMADFLNIRLKDLPAEQANQIIEGMSPTVRRQLERSSQGNILNAFALPQTVKQPLSEMLEYIRGAPNEANDLAVRMLRFFGRGLGMRMDERAASEMVNSLMLGIYGATLAFRPKPVVRNAFQVIQNLGSRTSFAAVDVGMQRATTFEAFSRAVDDGIIDMTARGLPFGQEMTIQALESAPIETKGFLGAITGGIARSAVLDGRLARTWRRFAERGLVGIGHTDMYTRVAAAETADVFVRPWATKYLDDKITSERLLDRAMPYWESSIRGRFLSLLDDQGLEPAMQYVRRESSNIANYIYAKAAQPTALQRPVGRMGFQFGIWPIWRKDLMVRSIRNARGLDERMAYLAKEAMVWGALGLVGMKLGIDMVPWMANESVVSYSGGPLVQVAADIQNLLSSRDWSNRVTSFRRLARDNVIRMFPVGRLFMDDVVDAIQYGRDDPMRGFLHLMVGRPTTDDLSWEQRMMMMLDRMDEEQSVLGNAGNVLLGGGEQAGAALSPLP